MKTTKLWQWKTPLWQIAKALGCPKSTISWELRRNQSPLGKDWPDTVQNKALKRRHRPRRIDQNKELLGFILVLQEGKTMFIQNAPLPRKTAEQTGEMLVSLMKKFPKKSRQTLTLDNGGEFSGHLKWYKPLGIKAYFCYPYASWEKGRGVENTKTQMVGSGEIYQEPRTFRP